MIGPWPSGLPLSGQAIGTSVVRGASAQASHLVAMPEAPASIGSTKPRKSARVGGAAGGAAGAGERLLLADARAAVEGAAHQLEVGEAVGRHREPALVAPRSAGAGGGGGRGGARPSRRSGRRRAR